jgi:hypothetical protein
VTTRVTQEMHNKLSVLAYALDMSIASTATLLIEYSIKNTDLVNHLIRRFVASELDYNRMKQLKEVYKFVKKENPYYEEVNFSMFISYLFSELKCTSESFVRKLNDWLENLTEN